MVLADDDEYSVIAEWPCRLIRAWLADATWLAWEYFDGALAEAPASALPQVSSVAERIANAPVMTPRLLCIAASIWFEATQTEQA